MEHVDSELLLGKEELQFKEFIRHGDDFMKIEIFRRALESYTQALGTHVNDTLTSQKLDECKRKLKKESRIIIMIVILAAVIIASIYIGSAA